MSRTAHWFFYLAAVALLAGGAASWSWQAGVIDLPPVAVRTAGRVAGIVSGEVDMDVALPIVRHRQEHSLSCEIATLKMALNYLGVAVEESALIAQLPFDQTPKSGGVWGNPNEGFVGDIDGKMLVDGYGVYWGPIAELGEKYRRTEILRNATASEVAGHLADGRPVIVWGYYGRYRAYTWQDSSGQQVQAVNGEHTRIVTGFKGPASSPTHFSLIDPIYGELSWDVDEFMENWTSLGRHAVVVYGEPRWIRARGDHRVWEVSKDGRSRHYVPSWEIFTGRGGRQEAIVEVDNSALDRYKRGVDASI